MHNEKSAVTTARIAAATPYEPANPFLSNPFTRAALDVFASDDKVAAGAAEGTYEYRMVKDDAVVPADVDTDANAYEVKITWQRNVLHVAHLKPGRSFYVGEIQDKKFRCDYFIPSAKLGASRVPVLVGGKAVLPSCATGTVCVPGKPAMSFAEAIASGLATPCAELGGAHEIAVSAEATVKIQLDDIIIEVRGVNQARKVGAGFTMAAVLSGAMLCVLGSFVGHAGLLGAMAAFMPPLGDDAAEEVTDDQRYLIGQYLESAAEIEKEEAEKEMLTPDAPTDGTPGGTGTAAKGSSGKMGSETAPERNARWAVQGNNPTPYISKTEALKAAADFGMIGLINTMEGSKNEPHAPWAMPTSDGADPLSANGNMWGRDIGDSYGVSGLGLTGIGEGGDGLGEGIGLGNVGTIGHGAGTGCPTCQGFGNGNGVGFLSRGYKPKDHGGLRMAPVKLVGRLPPEVIQRVVRANFGRFRGCYQSALASNPNLQGRVAVRFVIGRAGTVTSASGSGDLPNQGVISCVTSAFGSLTFPQPEGGIVTVTYPIVFAPTN